MPTFDDHKEAAKAELKKLKKLEKQLDNLAKPRSWERFKAFFNGGTKKVTGELENKKDDLENQITQKTTPDFLAKYQEREKAIDEAVQKEVNKIRGQKAAELEDTLSTPGVGGNIKEKPKTPKVQQGSGETFSGPVTLDSAQQNPQVNEALHAFAKRTFAEESLNCHEAIEAFQNDVKNGVVSMDQLRQAAKDLRDEYIVDGAPQMVTLDNGPVKNELINKIDEIDTMGREELGQLFDEAHREVLHMVNGDVMLKFENSDEYKSLRSGPKQDVRSKMSLQGSKVGGTPNSQKRHM
jgi:hypothetical protein